MYSIHMPVTYYRDTNSITDTQFVKLIHQWAMRSVIIVLS